MKNIVKLNNLIQAIEQYDSLEDTPESEIVNRIKNLAEQYYLGQISKRAQEVAEPKVTNKLKPEPLTDLLATLKSNLAYLEAAHWISKGSSFYGDHLLFMRLYEESSAEVDAYAEKILALSNDEVVNPIKVSALVAEKISKAIKFQGQMDGQDLAKFAINSEQLVLSGLENLYQQLKDQETITLGFDDLLMAMHNTHEGHIYLLQQRLK